MRTKMWVAVTLLALLVTPSLPDATARSWGQVALPSGRLLQVEIADTPETRARGYMFREALSDREGMVFLMEQIDFHSFWMKNCRIALDIIWLDEKWRIVHVAKNLPPCLQDPCPSYQPMQMALYALEVQAGLAERERLRLGDSLIYMPPVPPPPAP